MPTPPTRQHRNFNPRSPCGERLSLICDILTLMLFQSTLPVRGATTFVSISLSSSSDFNPRSPCGERRSTTSSLLPRHLQFQSTLPVRGATVPLHLALALSGNFNPRSPCGERQIWSLCPLWQFHFNPRSPCGERHRTSLIRQSKNRFQSTLPVRGATGSDSDIMLHLIEISIHAPRAGSDMNFEKMS